MKKIPKVLSQTCHNGCFQRFCDKSQAMLDKDFRDFLTEKRVNAEGGTRTPTGRPIRPSNVRVYQFHHFGIRETVTVRWPTSWPEMPQAKPPGFEQQPDWPKPPGWPTPQAKPMPPEQARNRSKFAPEQQSCHGQPNSVRSVPATRTTTPGT